MIKSFKIPKKQLLILLVFSILTSAAMIVHGIFFDLEFEQIKRLTILGLIFTFVIIFPVILFLEWVFDINNKKEHDKLEKRVEKLEKILKSSK